MKKRFIIIALLIAILVIIYLNLDLNKKEESIDINNLEKVEVIADYAIRIDDMREVVGFADYYFIGKVVKKTDTVYKHKVPIETMFGTKMVGTPYTKYDIQIIKNIKGELPDNINILKKGGVSEDKKSLILIRHDVLPEVGKTYEFTASTTQNGELLISGENSSNEVNIDDGFEKYKKIYKNEIPYKRDRFKYNPTN